MLIPIRTRAARRSGRITRSSCKNTDGVLLNLITMAAVTTHMTVWVINEYEIDVLLARTDAPHANKTIIIGPQSRTPNSRAYALSSSRSDGVLLSLAPESGDDRDADPDELPEDGADAAAAGPADAVLTSSPGTRRYGPGMVACYLVFCGKSKAGDWYQPTNANKYMYMYASKRLTRGDTFSWTLGYLRERDFIFSERMQLQPSPVISRPTSVSSP